MAREIHHLRELGFDITVFAAAADCLAGRNDPCARVCYRPALLSIRGVQSVAYVLWRYPLGVFRLLGLILRLVVSCPREAKSLLGNMHTIGCFAKHLDRRGIRHVHAYFLSWPAVIGLAVSTATGRTFSIGAHARDIFVERGDVTLKVSRAKFVVVCTQQGLQQLKAQVSPRDHAKLVLNYHGVEVNGSWSRRPADASEFGLDPVVVAVGRLVPKKGFSDLLKAFAGVIRCQPRCKLVLVGNGPERECLCRLIQQMSLEGSVQLLPWQEAGRTRQLIMQATVLAAPSVIADDGDRDGIPNVILEAFAVGTPVVATGLPGMAEAIENGSNGVLTAPGDVPAMGSALRRLLEDGQLGDCLSRNAHETAVRRFNVLHNTQHLAQLFLGAH